MGDLSKPEPVLTRRTAHFPAAGAEADRIRTVESAKAEAEQARMTIYRDLPPGVMLGLAARELAGKLDTIEHLNITPDLLATVLGEFRNAQTTPATLRH